MMQIMAIKAIAPTTPPTIAPVLDEDFLVLLTDGLVVPSANVLGEVARKQLDPLKT
jgi:hypothetical protein